MAIDRIIFDWSGVLSDDFSCVLSTLNSVLEELGHDHITAEYLRKNYRADPADFWREAGIDKPMKAIQEIFDKHFAGKKPKPVRGSKEALESLYSSTDLMILSTHPQKFLEAEINDYGFCRYFDPENIFGSVVDKAGVIKCLRTDLTRTLFIGDTYGDMIAGNEAGVISVGVLTGYNDLAKLQPYAKHVISDLGWLNNLLEFL